MRLVIQRVKNAVVKVDTEKRISGGIKTGLLVLLGIGDGDSEKVAGLLAEKLLKLRIMTDKNGKMNLSVREVDGEILVVSQFTLYADTSSGNRPSFLEAAKPDRARDLYLYFINKLKESGLKVACGEFGAYMSIDATLDGPVTIIF